MAGFCPAALSRKLQADAVGFLTRTKWRFAATLTDIAAAATEAATEVATAVVATAVATAVVTACLTLEPACRNRIGVCGFFLPTTHSNQEHLANRIL